jgi:hypothetical protein
MQRWWLDPLMEQPAPVTGDLDGTYMTDVYRDHSGPSTHQMVGHNR